MAVSLGRRRTKAARGERASRASSLAAIAVVAVAVSSLILAAALRSHMLGGAPFWTDEAWVADFMRAPLRKIGLMVNTSPLLWLLSLRVVPHVGGPERYRIVPYLFGVASVLPALAAGLRFRRPLLTAAVCAFGVALSPVSVGRPDLKQYTADGFFALLLVALLIGLERDRRAFRLAAFTGAGMLAVLFSSTAAFVLVTAFAAMLAVALARGERAWARMIALAGAVTGAYLLVWYRLVLSRGLTPGLAAYWQSAYVPTSAGMRHAAGVVAAGMQSHLQRTGLGPWPFVVALAASGTVAMWRAGYRAASLVAPALLAEFVALGVLHRYPFTEPKTATYVVLTVGLVAAVGLSVWIGWLGRRAWTLLLAVVLAAYVLHGLVPAASHATGAKLPLENVPAQVAYLTEHRGAAESIVVSFGASYAFGYYWTRDRPDFIPTGLPIAIRFEVRFPPPSNIVVTGGKLQDAIDGALRRAVAAARTSGSGAVWVVVSHSTTGEMATWRRESRAIGPTEEIRLPNLGKFSMLLRIALPART